MPQSIYSQLDDRESRNDSYKNWLGATEVRSTNNGKVFFPPQPETSEQLVEAVRRNLEHHQRVTVAMATPAQFKYLRDTLDEREFARIDFQ